MSKSLRHKSRIIVIQSRFADLQHSGDVHEIFSYVMNEFGNDVADQTFGLNLLNGIYSHLDEIHDVIGKAAPEWPLKKIAAIDLIVLELGVYEILYCDDIPDLVAINEAVEISKEYGGYNNSKFVNGVLSNVMNNKNKYL